MQMDYGASTLSQWVFARFLSSGLYDEYMVSLRMQLRRAADAALETLERLFAGRAHWNVPRGGFYVWLTFDEPVRTGRLFQRAIEHGVLLNPGRHLRFRGGQLAAPELLLHHAGGVRGCRRNPGLFGIGLDGGFGLDSVQANPPLSVSKPPAATGQGTPCGRISFSRG